MSYVLEDHSVKEITFSDLYLKENVICHYNTATFISLNMEQTEITLEPMKELKTADNKLILRVVTKDKFVGTPDDKYVLKNFTKEYGKNAEARLEEYFKKLLFLCGIVNKIRIEKKENNAD